MNAHISRRRLGRSTAAKATPGVYVAAIGSPALVALWRWPETAFRPVT